MKTSHLTALTATVIMMTGQSINAESLIRPRASLGFDSYELTMSNLGSGTITSSYMTLGVGATIAKDQLYFDLGITKSLNASFDDSSNDEDSFSRQDVTLTAGIALDSGLSIFGGYKTGSSEYTYVSDPANYTFVANGLFGGAIYSIPMEQNSLSFSGALALMKGVFEIRNDVVYGDFDVDADTVGISLGAAYNIHLSENDGLSFKGAYRNYVFSDLSIEGITLDGFEITETIVSIEASYFVNF